MINGMFDFDQRAASRQIALHSLPWEGGRPHSKRERTRVGGARVASDEVW